jgi:hypothetical protein
MSEVRLKLSLKAERLAMRQNRPKASGLAFGVDDFNRQGMQTPIDENFAGTIHKAMLARLYQRTLAGISGARKRTKTLTTFLSR